jgi:hypothetical protein
MRAVALDAVVATVTAPGVPLIVPEVPTDALAPVAMIILFPAVARERFPLVAVMFPRVAVRLVAEVMEPAVVVIFPAVATMFPVVAVIPVPAVKVVPEASVVVVVREPGAVITAGRDRVIALVPAVTVSWDVVPLMVKLPAVVGSMVLMLMIPEIAPPPRGTQGATPGNMKTVVATVLSHRVPFTYARSVVVGFLVANIRSGGCIALTPKYCRADLVMAIYPLRLKFFLYTKEGGYKSIY